MADVAQRMLVGHRLVSQSFVDSSPFRLAKDICTWVNDVDGRWNTVQSITILPTPAGNGEFAAFVFYWM
jgi:hypothetical protein